MRKTETFFSANDEDFTHSCAEDAVTDIWESSDEFKNGDEVVVFEQEFEHHLACDFLPQIAETLTERAWDECGEHAENWEFSREDEKRLQEAVSNFVDEWCAANKLECPLWKPIGKSRKLHFRFVGADGEAVPVEPQS